MTSTVNRVYSARDETPQTKNSTAIVRPGRCLSKVEFGKFDEHEALEWAKRNQVVIPDGEAWTWASLADLYQAKAKSKKQSPVTV